jgi:DNA-binding NtrC family response regulator
MGVFILTSGLKARHCDQLCDRYRPPEFRVTEIMEADRVIAAVHSESPRIVILGSSGRTIDEGLAQVQKIKGATPNLPVILISRKSSEERAIAAFRAGTDDYFKEPVAWPVLLKRIDDFIQDGTQGHRRQMPKSLFPAPRSPRMIGRSPGMRATIGYLRKVAATDSTVLITGETGTGKELAAEMIHYHSARSKTPLVSVNCAALPESLAESELFGYERGAFTGAVAHQKGKFVQANGGTIFLDEIGDMDPFIQAKILHTIERKVVYPLGGRQPMPLDVRIIAATNQDPETLINDGRFREDLFYRLNIARVNMMPLRNRREDIPALIDHAIAALNRRFNQRVVGLTPEAMAFFQSYAWPGNVRELMNLLEATFINLPHNTIAYADLPGYFRAMLTKTQNCLVSERQNIVSALLETNWNKSRAAQQLKWSRMTLYRKMARYKIVENRNRG